MIQHRLPVWLLDLTNLIMGSGDQDDDDDDGDDEAERGGQICIYLV